MRTFPRNINRERKGIPRAFVPRALTRSQRDPDGILTEPGPDQRGTRKVRHTKDSLRSRDIPQNSHRSESQVALREGSSAHSVELASPTFFSFTRAPFI